MTDLDKLRKEVEDAFAEMEKAVGDLEENVEKLQGEVVALQAVAAKVEKAMKGGKLGRFFGKPDSDDDD